jgi:hypothetical protein
VAGNEAHARWGNVSATSPLNMELELTRFGGRFVT